ncbi:MAG TPA: ATP-binding protein [Pseudomonadales bacterium]|nr:ATP-binding protein [Pseudomonadales bacterium]
MQNRARLLVTGVSLYALVGGIASLTGWAADIPSLADWDHDGIAIQPNAALAAICASLGLIALTSGRTRVAAVLAVLVALIGATALFQWLTGIDLEFVNTALMFDRAWGRIAVVSPGRMGPPGAVCWTLVGVALALAARPSSAARRVVPTLGLATFALALLSIIGYLYDSDPLYSVAQLTVIALQTATFILAVSIALVAAVPEHLPMRWLLADGATGMVARRTLPVIIVLPLLLGRLRLAGESLGLYDSRFGIAIFSLLMIATLCALVGWTIATISRHERALRESERRLTDTLTERNLTAHQLEQDQVALTRLQSLSTKLVPAGDLHTLLGEIVAASAELTGTRMGSILLWDPTTQRLRIAAHCGYGEAVRDYFGQREITPPHPASTALERLIVSDIDGLPPGLTQVPEVALLRREGIRAIQSTALVDREGKLLGRLSNHFVTPHQPTERELRYVDLLARMTADVIERASAEQALRDSNRHKDAFIATLAHELRGPLAPMMNSLELLDRAGDDAAIAARARSILLRQMRQLTRLVDDLVDVSRISRDKLELRKGRVELRPIIDQAIESCAELARTLRHELMVSIDPRPVHLYADPARLVQVFGNLLNNAYKYTSPNGRIELRAACENGALVVRVTDSGIGIAREELESVFEIFTQSGRSVEQQQGGLGIGLYLVKRIVELHDGTVEARSAGSGCGSEFIVRLPILTDEGVAENAVQSAPAPTVVPRRFLVVDDNRDSVSTLDALLKLHGHQTRTAHDGAQALALMDAFHPDVVLLDLGMPNLNGFDTCRRIRELPWGRSVMIVALTGWGSPEDRRRTNEAGFDHHFIKPVEYASLMQVLDGSA